MILLTIGCPGTPWDATVATYKQLQQYNIIILLASKFPGPLREAQSFRYQDLIWKLLILCGYLKAKVGPGSHYKLFYNAI